MRQFKFRAWDVRNKFMRSDIVIEADDGNIGMLMVGYNQERVFENRPKDDFILMQFTGLKDENVIDIYEGDKVSFTVFDCFDNDTQYEGFIVWSGTRFMIWNKPDSEYYGVDGGFDLDWIWSQDDEFKVIGNKYEGLKNG